MQLPVRRVVLYKHGVGYFEREGTVTGETTLSLSFKQAEVSDILKSLTVLDLDGGHVASVSYDSMKPLEQLLSEVALSIPDQGSLVGLLPQIKGSRVSLIAAGFGKVEGILLGIDSTKSQTAQGVTDRRILSLLEDHGTIRQFDLHELTGLELLDATIRRDLDYYLRTQLSAMKKEARTFTFFARGENTRRIRLSYCLEAPVWKATYRMLLGDEGVPPRIQGWAVVDNTQDEDWEEVDLSLIAGLPVSFRHDLYTPRYLRRPVVHVEETTGVLPPEVESGMLHEVTDMEPMSFAAPMAAPQQSTVYERGARREKVMETTVRSANRANDASSMPAQVRERKIGDLFEYQIEHPVTIRRNQSALVPIVLRPFEGRPVLLHNRLTRPSNPMRCVEFKNTTGLTLEGGPVTVLESGSYVGEGMLETTKPDEQRLLPYAVELSVHVLDNVKSFTEKIHRIVIRQGRLTQWTRWIQQTTYHLDNKSDREQTVYLDHPRDSGWNLLNTPTPFETTEKYWRFRFALPAKQVTTFTVQQEQSTQHIQSLTNMDTQTFAVWLDQKYVDGPTETLLRRVIGAQKRIAELDTILGRLQEEQNRIHVEQQRIRDNLQSLGDRPSEKELRERFVRTLSHQEDRLETIHAELASHTADKEQAQANIQQLLDQIEFEGEL